MLPDRPSVVDANVKSIARTPRPESSAMFVVQPRIDVILLHNEGPATAEVGKAVIGGETQ